jgi:hypothetical protein
MPAPAAAERAQARDRPGRLSSNAANAAVAIVATEPSTASHMSGIAVMRRHIAVTSANIAIATATAATSMSQISARSAGGSSGRTGRRSATSAPIRRSLESSISISAIHLEAQRAQRPMQVHLERSFAAPRHASHRLGRAGRDHPRQGLRASLASPPAGFRRGDDRFCGRHLLRLRRAHRRVAFTILSWRPDRPMREKLIKQTIQHHHGTGCGFVRRRIQCHLRRRRRTSNDTQA